MLYLCNEWRHHSPNARCSLISVDAARTQNILRFLVDVCCFEPDRAARALFVVGFLASMRMMINCF